MPPDFDPAELWDQKRREGLSAQQATAFVEARLAGAGPREATAPLPDRTQQEPESIGQRIRRALIGRNGREALAGGVRGFIGGVPGLSLLANVDDENEGGAEKALRSGLTFGFGDELRAATRAAVDPARPFSATYAARVAEERDDLDRYRGDHPVLATGLEIAGGLATLPAGAAGRTAQGVGALRRAGQLARVGGATGAAFGAGTAEGGLGDRARGAALGGTIGAVAAPVVGGAANLAGRAGSALLDVLPGVRPAVSSTGDRVREALARTRVGAQRLAGNRVGGIGDPGEIGRRAAQDAAGGRSAGMPMDPDAVREVLEAGGEAAGALRSRFIQSMEDRGLEKLAQAWSRGTVSLDDALAALQQADPSKPITLMELAGQTGNPVQRLARGVHTTPGRGGTELGEMLEERVRGQLPRVRGDLEAALGQTRERGFMGTMDDLAAERSAAARPLYQRAFEAPPVNDARLDALLRRPSMRRALQGARNIAEEEGEALPALALEDGISPTLDVRTLHYAKLALDDMLDLGRRGATPEGGIGPTQARAVAQTRAELLALLDELVPEYAQARAAWAGPSAVRSAMEEGTEAMRRNVSPEEVQRTIGGMGDSEAGGYRRGVLESLMGDAEMKREGVNLARPIIGVPGNREKLAAAAVDEDAFAALERALRTEDEIVGARNFVRTGSNTADKLQDVADLGGGPFLEEATQALGSGNIRQYLLNRLMRSGAVRLTQGRTERMADAISPHLQVGARGNREALEQLIERLREIQARQAERAQRAVKRSGRAGGQLGEKFAAD